MVGLRSPMSLMLVLAVVCLLSTPVSGIYIPSGCTLTNSEFECDFRNALPLSGVEFSPPPQRLTITYVFGQFDSTQFTNFSDVNQTYFDSNYDATLTLICGATGGGGGLLTFDNTSFDGMEFYKNIHIQNCEIEHLIPNAFEKLGTLNYLGFQGGYLNVINRQCMHGLDIRPDNTAVNPLGELRLDDVDLIPGGIPTGVTDPLVNLAIVTMKHSRISTIMEHNFRYLDKVHTLNLDDNPFTYMVKTAFRNMTALSRVSLKAIPWQCTCNNLWFVEDFVKEGIEFDSEVVCDTPGQWTGIRGKDYIANICEDNKCDTGSMPSVDFGVVCVTYLQIFIYCLAFLSILLLPATVYVCYKTRKMAAKQSGGNGIRMMTPRKPPPRQQAPMGHHRGHKQSLYGSHPADSHA